MKINVFLIIGSVLFLTSCAAKLTSSMQRSYAPLDSREEVKVFGINEQAPPNAEKLGTLKVGDSGFSVNCSYAVVLDKATTETRRVGGNILKLTEHKRPDIWSTCHRIKADVLRVDNNIADYFDAEITYTDSIVTAVNTQKNIFPRFRAALDGGWQYRTARLAGGMDKEWRDHYRKMKSGFHYDVQAGYFFSENSGVELMFSRQMFGNSSDGYLTDTEGNFVTSGEVKQKIALNYIGANYLIRLFDSKKKNSWLFSFGLGYMGYNDRLFFNNIENIKRTAGTLGSNASIGYDIGLSKNLGIGFKLSAMGGSFRNYKRTLNGITTNETMPEKTAEGLGTIKLSVGLRFNQ